MRTERTSTIRRTTSLTALVDVVFLLLLFFMLASTFSRYSEIDVALGGSGKPGVAAPERANVLVSVAAEGRYAVNGMAVEAEDLAAALRELGGTDTQLILLRPLSGATTQDIVSALEIARDAAAGDVVLVR